MKKEALEYHIGGKVATKITKSMDKYSDLNLAYSPGVAYPCLEIERDSELAYKYTSKNNLVGVVSDGSAVLGLGNIGGIAGKPVMEGKACLFKKFADVDAYDIELSTQDADEIIKVCKAIAPTFGGINLEDIAAPKCFRVEKELQNLGIPVMHDDQHGTAIISTAGIINAAELTGKKIEELKVVVCGAGAAGIASARMYRSLGIKNIILVDTKGVISTSRKDLNEYKLEFAIDTDKKTLEEVMVGADVFLGLSAPGTVTKEMVKSMADHPIIFALANPTPEIFPSEVHEVRDDAIVGTGRSDFDNQINNVLGFPYIFRGALDVKATAITENMKMNAAKALAKLAKEEPTAHLKEVYVGHELKYGKNMIIPKPFDERAKAYVSTAVAKGAIEDGVARVQDFDLDAYFNSLLKN